MSSFTDLKTSWSRKIVRYLERHQHPLLYQWRSEQRERLLRFENCHRDQDCFIIGNGPSLNKMDLESLNGHFMFGMNKIHLIFDRAQLDLSYHVCVNPLVIEQSASDFADLSCPSFLAYDAFKPDFPRSERTHFLSTFGSPLSFGETVLEPICEGWTVTFVALQLAYFMGFRRVFLVGVDHNFKVTGKPNAREVMAEDDHNHFSPDYFKGKQWDLPDLEGSEIAYRLAKFYFNRDGREIFDATVGGKLDVFPKIDFDEALKRCQQIPSH